MYLEISNIAAALNKNQYEPKEKMLLVSWARHEPLNVLNYLKENNCIINLGEEEETFSKLREETYKSILPKEFDVKDLPSIQDKIIEDYKKKRNNEQSDKEIKELKKLTDNLIKKDLGNVQEDILIKKENYTRGNDKMYYYNISDNFLIGGKHDASNDKDDILIEIKTRTRRENVRRNVYDLYQLIGYLLATKFTKGKIVQVYNQEKFDSDESTAKEFGLIDIEISPYKEISIELIEGLKIYEKELTELISTSKYNYLDIVIPKGMRPIAKYDPETEELCEENIKFKNLFRFINKI